jgi:hypothetical protein
MRSFLAVMTVSLGAATHFAQASCVLPEPDGGGATPSKANLRGRIARVEADGKVVVTQAKTNRAVTVVLPSDAEVYTAFGGDAPQGQLRAGQTVWVWFQDCKQPKVGLPTSAYFQIYSADPNDRP